jgi:hypothetical protein
VRGAVNRAHAAPADFALDAKPPGDDMGGVHLLTLSFGKEGSPPTARLSAFVLNSWGVEKKEAGAALRRV